MRILNISSILPLVGLKRENDIILRIQDYLSEKYKYQFVIAKSLAFVPRILLNLSYKWNSYYNYQKKYIIKVDGYNTYIYSWLSPPTSNFWINYILIPINWVWFNLKVKNKLIKEVNNAELLVSQNLIPDALVAYWLFKSTNKPFIINLRGDSKTLWFRLPLLRKVIHSAKAIITHSPTNYNKFNKYYELILIPHPIDDLFFTSLKKCQDKIKLLSVCRLLELKNINWVLEALAVLKRQGYEFEYRIVGDGPEFERLKQLVVKLDLNTEVMLLGYLDRNSVSEKMHEANIFIMPSYPETLGRVFLEAAAAGCIVIGHENTGIDGLFTHNVSAIFVNKYNLTSNLRDTFDKYGVSELCNIINASSTIVKKLKWVNIGSMYHELYESILKK